jgi:tRNA (guanine26-N2/guanine27-N2)-dimethyltransferase
LPREEGLELPDVGLFFNPHMRLNRSVSSLAVGAIEERLDVIDGFSATGVRGLRYALENDNVESVTFVDIDPRARVGLEVGERLLPHKRFSFCNSDFNECVMSLSANFIEVDPFGSPIPFVFPAAYTLSRLSRSFLSLTATDTAVLCGPEVKACVKRYGGRSLNAFFTHEIGVRLLLYKVATFINPIDLAFKSLFVLSFRHYIKVFLELKRGARAAQRQSEERGFVVLCEHCGYQAMKRDCPVSWKKDVCPRCGHEMRVAGPLYTGDIVEPQFINKMIVLNDQREYADKHEIAVLLHHTLNENVSLPYSPHFLAKVLRLPRIPSWQWIAERVAERGGKVFRTHFSPFFFKTDLSVDEVLDVFSEFKTSLKNSESNK